MNPLESARDGSGGASQSVSRNPANWTVTIDGRRKYILDNISTS